MKEENEFDEDEWEEPEELDHVHVSWPEESETSDGGEPIPYDRFHVQGVFGAVDVAVGTTGPCGGDSGHGSRAVFAISADDLFGGYISLVDSKDYGPDRMVEDLPGYRMEGPGVDMCAKVIRIVAAGDDEINVLAEALSTAAERLRETLLEKTRKYEEKPWKYRS